jgi:hypothetical protein
MSCLHHANWPGTTIRLPPLQLQQDTIPQTIFRFQHAAMKYLRSIAVLSVLFTALATVAGTCLPLTTNSNLCANPPGTISSDGRDDVCVLVACCNPGSPIVVEIPSGSFIACSDVNCTSVCDLSNMRSSLGGEACDSTCTAPTAPPNNNACLGYLVNALGIITPAAQVAQVVASVTPCFNDLQNSQPIESCLNNCKCARPASLICAARETECAFQCGLTNIPPSCVTFLNDVLLAVLGFIPLGAIAERLEKATLIENLFVSALKCLQAPGPF